MDTTKSLGQYFTTHLDLLDAVKGFVRNTRGPVLEPSCGAGHIVQHLLPCLEGRDVTCVEIDDTIDKLPCLQNDGENANITCMTGDFLEYDTETRFSTIVGNPPYVKRYKMRNLYIEFVEKCLGLLADDGGELVFIIPSDFFKLTSASSVKETMAREGTITDVFHPHNESYFKNAAQDIVVFRYQKGMMGGTTSYNNETKVVSLQNGNIFFERIDALDMESAGSASSSGSSSGGRIGLNEVFDVKVGMVSGADKVFKNARFGNLDIKSFSGTHTYIYLETAPSQETDGELAAYLATHKEALLARRIKKFGEDDWFMWGCPRNTNFMRDNTGKECLYCATITRKSTVFMRGEVGWFDGSLLCLLPKRPVCFDACLRYFNSQDFLSHFKYAGRYKMGQKILMDCRVPVSLLR